MAYDWVVVGAGMFGASFARSAADRGKKVLVVEKRPHVGGMCHTEVRNGIVFHAYGPHVFHTNDRRIWEWVQRFADWIPFSVRTKAMAGGKLWSFPVNLMTLQELWQVSTPEAALRVMKEKRVPISSPSNLEEWALSVYGREIYEKFFEGYTRKQWGRDPATLPSSILERLPFRMTLDDAYFTDRWQAVPDGGYGPMFGRMLDGIEVVTGCDFLEDRSGLEKQGRVVYSGRIDEYFGYRFGELGFRTCDFETREMDGDFQGNAVVNYCDMKDPWTRIVEHKHFSNPRHPKTLVTWEFPMECGPKGLPLYPVADRENRERYAGYAAIPTGTVFAGRLGSFRYFDMCEVVAQAWSILDRLT